MRIAWTRRAAPFNVAPAQLRHNKTLVETVVQLGRSCMTIYQLRDSTRGLADVASKMHNRTRFKVIDWFLSGETSEIRSNQNLHSPTRFEVSQ